MFKFQPILKSTLWGGEKILPYKDITSSKTQIGESWELSAVAGCESRVAEGKDQGLTISELIARDGERMLGKRNFARFGTEFPLLIKFIDAHKDLSIQVHPNDELAARRHQSKGKAEMWYVIEAEPKASLRLGFAEPTTPETNEKSGEENTLSELLAEYALSAEEVFFLPAGHIHSSGAGSFIVEIQQTSDITYRIFDFDRCDTEGNRRELHTELAREAIDYTFIPDYRVPYTRAKNSPVELISSPAFSTTLYDLSQPQRIAWGEQESFLVVVCVAGQGELCNEKGDRLSLRQGETVLVPASTEWLELHPAGEMKILTAHIA